MKVYNRAVFVFFLLGLFCLGILPELALAQGAVNLPNPVNIGRAGGNTSTVLDLVLEGFGVFAGVIAIFAFGFLIINGYKLIIARDNPEAQAAAKSGLTWSAVGFVVTLLSFSIVAAVSNFLGGTGANELSGNVNNLQPPIGPGAGSGAQEQYGLVAVFFRILNGFLGLAMVTAVIMVVYGGYLMVSSAGNEEKVTKGKAVLKWAIAGIVVIALSFVILNGINVLFT